MYVYHKQNEIMQKIQLNSSNGQLHWFLIDFLWKWSIMDQNYANANASRLLAKIFKRYPDMPYESWRPGDSENVVVFYSIIFNPEFYCCPKSGQISGICLAKLWCNKKYMWLQYYVSGQIVESVDFEQPLVWFKTLPEAQRTHGLTP